MRVRPLRQPANLGTLARRPGPVVSREEALRVPRGELITSQPQGASQRSPLVRLPGVDFPTADSIAIDLVGDGDVAPAGGTAVLLTIAVPAQLSFRWAGIGFGADDEAALGFLTWAIFADPPQAFVPSYVGMPASVGSIAQLSTMFLLAGAETILTVIATSSAPVGTYHYVCRGQGWLYAEKEQL